MRTKRDLTEPTPIDDGVNDDAHASDAQNRGIKRSASVSRQGRPDGLAVSRPNAESESTVNVEAERCAWKKKS